ncbi:sensor domain-containing diguanylate cyclase [Maridesulfovibrio bastinii]|uniref:sensor domain-containing diguanylate cyclase n=1 Tax=Maridesulfovibrio bastinii TaxID=47157 RepID=UPI0003FFDADE|nr:diguanylate cyclase [Maridesulfovibrio bastinii]
MKIFKIFIVRFLPFAIIILGISAWSMDMQYRHSHELMRMNGLKNIDVNIASFHEWLDVKMDDLVFFKHTAKSLLAGKNNPDEAYNELGKIFLNFARSQDGYAQIRLLSSEGFEKVRVTVNNFKARLVPKDKLHSKSKRPYFLKALNSPGIIHLSRFDLNMENGKIEKPLNIVLRASVAVRNDSGKIIGVVVSNFSADKIFNILKKERQSDNGQVWLVNELGGWINCPYSENKWFYSDGDKKGFFQTYYPDEWKTIINGNRGSIFSSNGVFSYDRYSIHERIQERHAHRHVEGIGDWFIISRVPPEKNLFYWWKLFGAVIVVVVFWSGLSVWKRSAAFIALHEASDSLKESEQRFKDVTNASGGFTWETGLDGTFSFVTGSPEEIIGYLADELIGESPFELAVEEDSWNIRRDFLQAAESRTDFNNLEYKFRSKNGDIVWVSFSGVPMYDSSGEVTGFRGNTVDVTNRKEWENKLRESEELLSSVSNSIRDGLVLMDETGAVQHFNSAAVKLFNFSESDFMGLKLREYVRLNDNVEDDINLLTADYSDNPASLTCTTGVLDVVCTRSDGTVFNGSIAVSPLRREGQWWIVWSIRDVTDRKEAEEKLIRLATTDSLTGLVNRRVFMEKSQAELERAKRYNHPLSMMMLDIDHFKRVNDTYGHDAGDDVLQGLANVVLGVLRQVDCFARIGGEEFAVLLPDTDQDGAVNVAERVREAVEKTSIVSRSGELFITISIGVSTLSGNIDDLERMLKTADVALYASKRNGRNMVSISSSTDDSVD